MILFDPRVAIIPLPTLAIDEASIMFEMEIKATETQNLDDSSLIEIDVGGDMS